MVAIMKNEAKRLKCLGAYAILDTDFDETYDRLTRLASSLFHTSISAISLIDRERQWFKSRQGLEARETSRDIAFCNHAIQEPDVFEVNDASCDERFMDNPLVQGDPNIRFYAGAPLICPEGYALGTVCVIDPTPRDALSDNEKARLVDFSGIVMDLLNARRRANSAVNDLSVTMDRIDKVISENSYY